MFTDANPWQGSKPESGMSILVTGGAGFIGTNFVSDWIANEGESIVNIDKLTYGGNLRNLDLLRGESRHHFVRGDIADRELIAALLAEHRPRAVVHFAAESHVDRSILDPEAFINTNIVGSYRLLDTALDYWRLLPGDRQAAFRFLQISTDEVYGSLGPNDPAFSESTPYAPNSPYSASKAASDHLARAYFRTYGLPILMTRCSNNYGPYQFPEKLIPLMIVNAIAGRELPVYGDGRNIRDWMYVRDHCTAIRRVLDAGQPGEAYNIGAECEMANIDLVNALCTLLDELHPTSPTIPHRDLIRFVADRPGHDRRYALNSEKIRHELGWTPLESFESGLRKTVQWYLDNNAWIKEITSGQYRRWVDSNYRARGGA
jgi:dTDP-glucose 4,6-dehydratase